MPAKKPSLSELKLFRMLLTNMINMLRVFHVRRSSEPGCPAARNLPSVWAQRHVRSARHFPLLCQRRVEHLPRHRSLSVSLRTVRRKTMRTVGGRGRHATASDQTTPDAGATVPGWYRRDRLGERGRARAKTPGRPIAKLSSERALRSLNTRWSHCDRLRQG